MLAFELNIENISSEGQSLLENLKTFLQHADQDRANGLFITPIVLIIQLDHPPRDQDAKQQTLENRDIIS